MQIDEASQILVVILAVALAVFLVLGITLLIMLIKLSSQIKKTTTAVKNTAESVEGMVVNVTKIVSPAIIGKTIKDVFDKIKSDKKEKKQ
jgi:hypothetical protein